MHGASVCVQERREAQEQRAVQPEVLQARLAQAGDAVSGTGQAGAEDVPERRATVHAPAACAHNEHSIAYGAAADAAYSDANL